MGNTVGNIEGRLDIDLKWHNGVVAKVDIRSSRPLQTPRIFRGKSVDELLQTLPLLYSVCGTAQAHAAVTACEQALGLPDLADRHTAREALVWLETAKEHLWRVLLDWPEFLGLPQVVAGVGEMMQLIQRYRATSFPNGRPFIPGAMPFVEWDAATAAWVEQFERLLQEQVFGMPPAQWLALGSVDGLLSWASQEESPAAQMLHWVQDNGWSGLGGTTINPLPPLDTSYLRQQLEQPDANRFIAVPQLAGLCRETSPFTRVREEILVTAVTETYGPGLLARFTARLVELAGISERLRQGSDEYAESVSEQEPVQGSGIAQVEAARGRLIHHVVLDAGRVARYQILAPTEWNFHPNGVLAEGLSGLVVDSAEALRQQAALLINAIDPCVGYELNIEQD
ncbi:nickel-dependent hydrogenase large subunit [Sedimenticola sp.]|uniref:nickel-dependent hydrogenase large subunit n=1 Tax=Sedimenticola sp. TaxID=1940285 RepID=UPI003D107E09